MKVIKVNNNLNSHIRFRNTNIDSNDASLMIQSPYAALNFSREKYIAEQAGSVDAGLLPSLGYKLIRTFGYLTNRETPSNIKSLDVVA